jgi:hypothetical protein
MDDYEKRQRRILDAIDAVFSDSKIDPTSQAMTDAIRALFPMPLSGKSTRRWTCGSPDQKARPAPGPAKVPSALLASISNRRRSSSVIRGPGHAAPAPRGSSRTPAGIVSTKPFLAAARSNS